MFYETYLFLQVENKNKNSPSLCDRKVNLGKVSPSGSIHKDPLAQNDRSGNGSPSVGVKLSPKNQMVPGPSTNVPHPTLGKKNTIFVTFRYLMDILTKVCHQT